MEDFIAKVIPTISTVTDIVVKSKFSHYMAFFAANKRSLSIEIVFQGIQTEEFC